MTFGQGPLSRKNIYNSSKTSEKNKHSDLKVHDRNREGLN